jgi:hypothetical protein
MRWFNPPPPFGTAFGLAGGPIHPARMGAGVQTCHDTMLNMS